MSRKKKLDIGEFVEFGYLQEVNRRFFHPLGLQLEVCKGKGCTVVGSFDLEEEIIPAKMGLDFVWDRRSYEEGLLLSEVDPEKAERVASEMKKRRAARRALPECNVGGFQRVPRG